MLKKKMKKKKKASSGGRKEGWWEVPFPSEKSREDAFPAPLCDNRGIENTSELT